MKVSHVTAQKRRLKRVSPSTIEKIRTSFSFIGAGLEVSRQEDPGSGSKGELMENRRSTIAKEAMFQ